MSADINRMKLYSKIMANNQPNQPWNNHQNVPPAARNNYLARFVFDNEILGTRPHTVSLRPIRQAGGNYDDQRVLAEFARAMNREIRRLLRIHLPTWTTAQINQNVQGRLIMANWDNEGHANVEDVTLTEINEETFLRMFEEATANGSNPDLSIYDVTWKYFIIPNTLLLGGSFGAFHNTLNYKGINNWDKKLITAGTITHQDIGCASLAIAIGMDDKIKNPVFKTNKTKSRFKSKQFTKYCHELQEELELGKICTPNQLSIFPFMYPEWRLVIFYTVFTRPTIYIGIDYVQDSDHKLDKTVFIFHDLKSSHFISVSSIQALCGSLDKVFVKLCWTCCTSIRPYVGRSRCACGDIQGVTRAQKYVECTCGEKYQKGQKHRCGESTCRFCKQYVKIIDWNEHRCPIYIDPKSIALVFKGDENENLEISTKKVQHEAWIWDIESHFVIVPDEETDSYEIDDDGHFVTDDQGKIQINRVAKLAHLPNYIWCKNPFTEEEREFTTMKDFLEFAVITQNDGYNYFYAHNSAGYDTRLLFEAATELMKDIPQPIFKGTRFMKLTLKNCHFQDTLLHLPKSLAALGQAFKLPTEKGHFPHLFSTLENLDYEGPIPAIEYFDLTFSCRTKEDFDGFRSWHEEWRVSGRSWNYLEQRKLYCRNDVRMLSDIWLLYHENIINSLKDYPYLTVSPWFFPTMAGHVHKLMIRHLHAGVDFENMSTQELKEYSQTTWCAMEPEEQYYARVALRGGMTNICKYIYEGDLHYQDIQSSYPSVQMDIDNLYPIGSPLIEIHDVDYFPCTFHYTKPLEKCSHDYIRRCENMKKHRHCKLNLKMVDVQEHQIERYCLDFFGIITVDITPPKDLYHPLIQGYDVKKKKVIGSLDLIVKQTITSAILHEAMKYGYKVTKIYRADRYKAAESKFRNGLLGDMYVAKMKNAGPIPETERERMINTFKTKFNIDLGDVNKYTKNAVAKQVAKGPITSAWGKHAESLDHTQAKLVPSDGDVGKEFYDTLLENKVQLKNVRKVGPNTMFDYTENRSFKRPELHKTYLPVAVFVTAYGRLKLWRELVKIDPRGTPNSELRVLMYDTDSIVYSCSGCDGAYHIEEGDCLGDWETEDLEKENGGLKKFYAIGPKSYSIVCGNGKTLIKLKGATLKHAHSKIMSPEIMRDLVISKNTPNPKVSMLPQMSFDYKLNYQQEAMTTRKFLKAVQFHEKDVKGVFDWTDYRGYPEGYKI